MRTSSPAVFESVAANSAAPMFPTLLRRKCNCGNHTAGGSCSACSKPREGAVLQRAANGTDVSNVPTIVRHVLNSPGESLDPSTRAFMEPKFGRDFGNVRVHTGSRAGDSARAVGAIAYTVGRDVVFGDGQYSPATREGKSLLAHELTHVAQNRGAQVSRAAKLSIGPEGDRFEGEADENARAIARDNAATLRHPAVTNEPGRLSRATFKVGSAKVEIDYGDIIYTRAADYESAIETRFASWTGSPASTIHADVTALSTSAKEWVLFALDLLFDNPIPALDKVDAVKRLIEHAPSAKFQHGKDQDPTWNFANEALSVSGWFEKAITAGLSKPTGVKASFVQQRLGTGGGGGSACPSQRTALDVAKLNSDLPPKLEAYLKTVQVVANPKNQAFSPFQKIGDAVQLRARRHYAPYADRSSGAGNTLVQQWQYSSHMVSSQSAAGTPSPELRRAYIDSRARIVGEKGVFSAVNFETRCAADNTELKTLVEQLETQATFQGLVDPILRQKSYTKQDATPKEVVISPEGSAQTDDCDARWETIRTICHELMHVMVHDDFRKAEKGRMVMREGWPEVLGHYLYEKITGDSSMKTKMEDGLPSSPCSSVPSSTIGYGDAGKKAEEIRVAVKDDRFRAAFFLGQLELAGIQPKLAVGTSNDPLEKEADSVADRAVDGAPSGNANVAASHVHSYHRRSEMEAPPIVQDALSISGRPLEPGLRRDMEQRLGHDFSNVRVHTDGAAGNSAAAIRSRAYTVGSDIIFAAGEYAPHSPAGRKLLSHELTHVVQQAGVPRA